MNVEKLTLKIPAVEAEILEEDDTEDSEDEEVADDQNCLHIDESHSSSMASQSRSRFHEIQLTFELKGHDSCNWGEEDQNLEWVGQQLWNGAMFASDWVIENGQSALLSGKTVIEVGSGIGLLSFICRFYARKVTCTDKHQDVVALAQTNAKQRNEHVGDNFSLAPIEFYCFDWEDPRSIVPLNSSIKRDSKSFMKEQPDPVVIASDILYDEDSAKAFFETMKAMLDAVDVPILLFQENRVNFSLATLATEVHTGDVFEEHVNIVQDSPVPVDQAQQLLQERTYSASRKPFVGVRLQPPVASHLTVSSRLKEIYHHGESMCAWMIHRNGAC